MLRHTIGHCLKRFHKLEEICIYEHGYDFTLTFPGHLKIRDDLCLSSGGDLGIPRLVKWLLINPQTSHRYSIECFDIDVNLYKEGFGFAPGTCERVLPYTTHSSTVKRILLNLSASLPTSRSEEGVSVHAQDTRQDIRLELILRIFLEGHANLEDVKIRFPYYDDTDSGSVWRGEGLYRLSSLPLRVLKSPRLSKLDLGNLSITEKGLTEMLEEHHMTLQDLKLTRLDFNEGNMIRWFSRIGCRLNHLQRVAFHDNFWEVRTDRVVDMDTPIERENGHKFEDRIRPLVWLEGCDKPRTIGFELGEMCLARRGVTRLLKNKALDMLEDMMKPRRGLCLRHNIE